MTTTVIDRFGHPIQPGDRVAYVHRRLNGAPLRLRFGQVIGFFTSDLRVNIKPDHQSIYVECESYHCTVLNHNNPQVTLFLLENSVS